MFINSSMPVHVTNFNITAQGNSGTNGNVAPYLVDYAIGNSSSVVNKSGVHPSLLAVTPF